jgi:hypothetical protein
VYFDERVNVSLFFEEPVMTGDIFLAMMENNALCYVPVGKLFWLFGAPPYFSSHIHTFQDRDFPDNWIGRGGSIPWPLILQILLLWLFSSQCL